MTDTEATALAGCPFCGGEDIGTTWSRMTDQVMFYGVRCSDCGIELDRATAAEAIAAWNTRPPAAPAPSNLHKTQIAPAAPATGEVHGIMYAQGFAAGIEAAAKACETERVDVDASDDKHADMAYNLALDHAAAAIRALNGGS